MLKNTIVRAMLAIFLVAAISFCMVACGKDNSAPTQAPTETVTAETVPPVDLPFGSDTGDGTMMLRYTSGTTEDGKVIDVLTTADSLIQVGISTREFDGSHFSYVYIDGYFLEKAQYGNSDTSLTLQDDSLTEGEHIVSVVQYDSNEESGNIITYKEAKYKVTY